MGLRDFAEIRETVRRHPTGDTVSARISPEEFQKAYAQNKDSNKTVIRFKDSLSRHN